MVGESKIQIFPAKALLAKKYFDFFLAMVGNLLILAHFGETGHPRQENFQHFPCQPREEQIFDISCRDLAQPQTSPNRYE